MIVLPVFLLAAAMSSCSESLRPAALALQQNNVAKARSILQDVREDCAHSSAFFELRAVTDESAGDASAAEDAFRTALALEPRSPRLLAELGALYLRNKNPADAKQTLERALTLDPSNVAAAKYLIGACVELGNWDRAAGLFQQIGLGKNSLPLQDPILVIWLARTLIETRQTARIEDLFSRERPGMSPALLFSLGTLFAQHRMYQLAVDYLKEVPAQNADDAVDFNLGLCYSHLRKFEEAQTFYFQAIDQRPGHTDAYLQVGLNFTASGQPRMAIPWLFHAHGLAPARSDITYALAEQLIELEYFDTAKEVLAQELYSVQQDALLLVAAGDLKRVQGDTAAAIDSYQKALAEHPQLPAALVGIARADISQSRDGEARKLLRAALSGDPGDALANAELGRLEARDGNSKAALEYLGRAWERNQSNTDVALELARVYIRRNQPSTALQLLGSIRPVMQQSPAFHFELARVYSLLGRPGDARAEQDAFTNLQASTKDALSFENPRTYVH
jgi:tetratricopeptide (TPR) repeat protein